MTPFASELVSRLGALSGSFRDAAGTLGLFWGDAPSESKVRSETLAVGRRLLDEQQRRVPRLPPYPAWALEIPDGAHAVPLRLAISIDGGNVPCVRRDTRGVRGKNGGEAGTRPLRFAAACEYRAVTAAGEPVPVRGSFTRHVTDGGSDALEALLRRIAAARGATADTEIQGLADGEEALEKVFRRAFPKAAFPKFRFTNDIVHALEHTHACLAAMLDEQAAGREYRVCRGIMRRHGAASVAARIRRVYGGELEASDEARAQLKYLEDRKDNMRYGWLRRNGYYISSAHAEGTVRLLGVRRCKQAGMHWRLKNALHACAVAARLRSGTWTPSKMPKPPTKKNLGGWLIQAETENILHLALFRGHHRKVLRTPESISHPGRKITPIQRLDAIAHAREKWSGYQWIAFPCIFHVLLT